MKLRDYIDTEQEYAAAEAEIKAWVEQSYPGLSIEFNWPAPEIVQVDARRKFTKCRVLKITEAVNAKIGEVLEQYAERIYIAERLDRIYENHPNFDINVESMDGIKQNPLFLKYLDELIIRGQPNGKLQ